jgi:hypothetical protein
MLKHISLLLQKDESGPDALDVSNGIRTFSKVTGLTYLEVEEEDLGEATSCPNAWAHPAACLCVKNPICVWFVAVSSNEPSIGSGSILHGQKSKSQ